MASNVYAGGTTDDTIEFSRPVDYLNVHVGSGVTFALSLDGTNYITIPAGFYSFRIGPIEDIYIQSNGAWQLIAVQA